MISVVTPTHDTRWLSEVAESLQAQTCQNFEWVIVPNKGAIVPKLPGGLRIRIEEAPEGLDKIGAIKSWAFNQAQGDIHVELDHDDMLIPDALAIIQTELVDADFVYSNCAEFWDETWKPATFGAEYGWEQRPVEVYGHRLVEMRAFDPGPWSFRHVSYAPNHVRAWQAEAYHDINRHDKTLAIADDHDLCCRFYIHKRVKHIDKCLYLYRLHSDNSWRTAGSKAWDTSWNTIYPRHAEGLVQRWCKDNDLAMLDMGGALRKREGYICVDQRQGADILCKVGVHALPFDDNSVGLIRAQDFLEHVPRENVVSMMNDFYRVLAPGGWLMTMTPSTDGRGAWQDPTHCSFWNSNSFWYYTRKEQSQFVPEIEARFQAMRVENVYLSDWYKTHGIVHVRADLAALKGGIIMPGFVEI